MVRTTRRSVLNRKEGAAEEKEDKLAEVLAKLANGESHWYTLNGDTSSDLLLCRQLGFFSRMDYYAFLYTKGLAAYRLNKKQEIGK